MTLQAPHKQKSHRLQFRFWLDVLREDEYFMAEYIEEMKEKRAFAQTIREALTLIRDLRAGRVEALLRLFPWIEDHFKSTPPNPTIEMMSPVQEQLQRLEKILLSSGNQPLLAPSVSTQSRLKSEDDLLGELEIKAAKSDENAAFNMILSSYQMGLVKLNEMPSACLEYGIARGKLPQSAQKYLKKADPQGPKEMEVTQFAPPDFDDLIANDL